jgi:hypothetical protein
MENLKKKEVNIFELSDRDGSYSSKNAYLLLKTLFGVRGKNQISKRLFYLFFTDHDLYLNSFLIKYPVKFIIDFFEKEDLRKLNSMYNEKKHEVKEVQAQIHNLEQQRKKKERIATEFRNDALKNIEDLLKK